jgi:hypothetical protein
MALQVRVTWDNPGSPLLPASLADITVNGQQPTTKRFGEWIFDFPTAPAQIALSARFSVSFGQVGAAPPRTEEVWSATQTYNVTGTTITPVAQPAYAGTHPLVDTVIAGGVNTAALLRLRTVFVDVTPFWMAYASKSDDYLAERDTSLEHVVALGFTGGTPLLWFASFPPACKAPPQPRISCLVYYRQTGEKYSRVDEPHQMNPLNQVLLEPITGSMDPRKSDVFLPYQKKPTVIVPFESIRCGWEDALHRSGKAVVMLHPWPSELEYGKARGGDVTNLARAAIKLLWAKQRIAQNTGGVDLGRLGFSGYSAGGPTFWRALFLNPDAKEAYCFDGTSTNVFKQDIIDWFNASPTTRCLRMSSGHQIDTHNQIRDSIDPGGTNARVTAIPGGSDGYTTTLNPLWNYTLSWLAANTPGAAAITRNDPDYWHAFAQFGGFIATPGPGKITFLQRFLMLSDF